MGDLTMDFLRLMLMAAMLLTSLQGQAADAANAPASLPTTHEVEFLRSPDKACTDCHKEQTEGMHGKHGQATNPNNLAPVTCTNCHGQPSSQHREGVKDVMRFSDSFNDKQSALADKQSGLAEKQSTESYPIAEQNGVCMSCHEPKPLREALWAHDVHATKLTCTSCTRPRSPWRKSRKSPASSSASTATASSIKPRWPACRTVRARRHHELFSS